MNLGVDVADEILSWLPVKSLIRFKVVCKDWYSHIHSDCFIAKHLKNQNTNKKALIYHRKGGILDHVVSICNEEEKEDNDEEEEDDSRTLFHQHQQYHIKDYMPSDFIEYIAWTQYYIEGSICFTLHDSVAVVGKKYTTEMRLEIWTTKELEQWRALWIKVLNIDLSSRISTRLGLWKCKNSNDFLFMFTEYDYWDNYQNEVKGIYINDRGEIKNGKTMTIKVKNNIVSPRNVLTYVESLVSVNRS